MDLNTGYNFTGFVTLGTALKLHMAFYIKNWLDSRI